MNFAIIMQSCCCPVKTVYSVSQTKYSTRLQPLQSNPLKHQRYRKHSNTQTLLCSRIQ